MDFPSKVNPVSLYGFAFQYADKKFNGGKFTGRVGPASNSEAIQNYLENAGKNSSPLDFLLYVPKGYANLNANRIPNVEETDDPVKIFTAHFKSGDEVW
jgi:hypothetical protein